MSESIDNSYYSFYSDSSSELSSLFKKEYVLEKKDQIDEVKYNIL